MKKMIHAWPAAGFAVLMIMSLFSSFNAKASPPPSWTQISENLSDVEVYYSLDSCSGNNVIAIKVKNTGNSDVELTYSLTISENGSASEKDEFSGLNVDVLANDAVYGACTLGTPPTLFLKLSRAYTNPTFTLTINPR